MVVSVGLDESYHLIQDGRSNSGLASFRRPSFYDVYARNFAALVAFADQIYHIGIRGDFQIPRVDWFVCSGVSTHDKILSEIVRSVCEVHHGPRIWGDVPYVQGGVRKTVGDNFKRDLACPLQIRVG